MKTSPVFRCALETLERLSESLDLTDLASRIIHPIVRILDSSPELQTTAMDTLCALVYQLGKRYSTFIPTVNKVSFFITQCFARLCLRRRPFSHDTKMADFEYFRVLSVFS